MPRDLESLSDAQLAAIAGEIDPDTDALVRTVWGEARNQDAMGRKAVAAVIRNRSAQSGQPIRDVVMAPGQFEPWGDAKVRPQLESLDPASDAYQSILADIEGDDDPTGGATHFYAPKAQAALGRAAPDWDDGSGVDIGDHRFFKIGYGQPQEAQPAPDLESLSDEELEAIAKGEEPPAPAPAQDDVLGDVEFISTPASALSARKSTVVDAEEQQPATPAQEAFYVGEIKAGRLDPEKVRSGGYKPGSEEFPLLQRDPKDLPKPGDWYLTPEGEKKQVTPVPWGETAANTARFASNPLLWSSVPMDPRSEAMRRALESGVLLGGRNELSAGLDSIGGLLEGGVPMMKERFGERLEEEDIASARARRDFPIAYDATAATGALATGAVLPTSLVPRLATGAGAGFLSTDGDLQDRAIGAGIGVVGGEALRVAAPKVAGFLGDLAGVPMRRLKAEQPVRINPMTNFPIADDMVGPSQIKAAQALERAVARDGGLPVEVALPSRGGPLPLDVGGPNMTGLAEVLSQSPGPGARIIPDAMGDRSAQAIRERVLGSLETVTGVDPAAVAGDFAAMTTNLRRAAAPLYEKAYAAGPIDSPRLTILATRPSMQRAMARAARIAAEEGRDPAEVGFKVVNRGDGTASREAATYGFGTPDGRFQVTGSKTVQDPKIADVVVQVENPTAQTWDYVKRGLDDIIEGYRDKTTRRLILDEEGRAIVGTTKEMREELVKLNPAYGDALAAGGEPLRLDEAYRSAPKLMANSVSEQVFTDRLSAMNEAEREALRGGWINSVFEDVRAGKLGLKALQTPAYQQKLRLLFGEDVAAALGEQVTQAIKMQSAGQRVLGGSPAYGRQAARADLEGQARSGIDMAAENIDSLTSIPKLSGKLLKEALKALPKKDQSVIGDERANAALAKALTDPDEMTRLLNLLQRYKAMREIPQLNYGGPGGYIGAEVASQPPQPR